MWVREIATPAWSLFPTGSKKESSKILKMSPPFKILSHEEKTSIVHTISLEEETFTMTTLAESAIDQEPAQTRRTKLEVALSINGNTKAWFTESRSNGKIDSDSSGSSLNPDDLKTFKTLWFHKWKPRIEMEEVYKVTGHPPEKMELTDDYMVALKAMKEWSFGQFWPDFPFISYWFARKGILLNLLSHKIKILKPPFFRQVVGELVASMSAWAELFLGFAENFSTNRICKMTYARLIILCQIKSVCLGS